MIFAETPFAEATRRALGHFALFVAVTLAFDGESRISTGAIWQQPEKFVHDVPFVSIGIGLVKSCFMNVSVDRAFSITGSPMVACSCGTKPDGAA